MSTFYSSPLSALLNITWLCGTLPVVRTKYWSKGYTDKLERLLLCNLMGYCAWLWCDIREIRKVDNIRNDADSVVHCNYPDTGITILRSAIFKFQVSIKKNHILNPMIIVSLYSMPKKCGYKK